VITGVTVTFDLESYLRINWSHTATHWES